MFKHVARLRSAIRIHNQSTSVLGAVGHLFTIHLQAEISSILLDINPANCKIMPKLIAGEIYKTTPAELITLMLLNKTLMRTCYLYRMPLIP